MIPDCVFPGAFISVLILWTYLFKMGGQMVSALSPDLASFADFIQDPYQVDFLFSALTERLLENNRRLHEFDDTISEEDAAILRDKLRGFYTYLNQYPSLMERRFYVGSHKPEVDQYRNGRDLAYSNPLEMLREQALRYYMESHLARHEEHAVRKRDFSFEIAEPACPSKNEWRLIHHAKNINDTRVEVFQPSAEQAGGRGQQWFYTVTCFNGAYASRRHCDDCCLGIDHKSFTSSCLQKKSYAMALVRKHSSESFDWDWIQINSSCNCAIAQKLG